MAKRRGLGPLVRGALMDLTDCDGDRTTQFVHDAVIWPRQFGNGRQLVLMTRDRYEALRRKQPPPPPPAKEPTR